MDVILSDEIGLEFALLGKYRARAQYRPVFAKIGTLLEPVAAQGSVATTLAGQEVSADTVLGSAPSAASRHALDLLALTLAIRNHARSDADALDLYVDFPSATGAGLGLALDMLEDLASSHRGRITLFMLDADKRTIDRLKDDGIGIGLIARLYDQQLADTIAFVNPEVIRFEGGWLERACNSPSLAVLMAHFVASCHEAGATVMLPGIDHRSELRAALDMNADLYAGDLLCEARGAGAVMDLSPLPLAGLTVPNVLPFARRSRSG